MHANIVSMLAYAPSWQAIRLHSIISAAPSSACYLLGSHLAHDQLYKVVIRDSERQVWLVTASPTF